MRGDSGTALVLAIGALSVAVAAFLYVFYLFLDNPSTRQSNNARRD